ncbi:membrane protein FAM159A-like [Arapaima gigas]
MSMEFKSQEPFLTLGEQWTSEPNYRTASGDPAQHRSARGGRGGERALHQQERRARPRHFEPQVGKETVLRSVSVRACSRVPSTMSAECTGYYSSEDVFVDTFTCPKADSAATAVFCCGFNDIKYCCDDPNSFFPYEYGYMWWLR